MKLGRLLALLIFSLCSRAVQLQAMDGSLGSASSATTSVFLTIEPRVTYSSHASLPLARIIGSGFQEVCANFSQGFEVFQFMEDRLSPIGKSESDGGSTCVKFILKSELAGVEKFKALSIVLMPS